MWIGAGRVGVVVAELKCMSEKVLDELSDMFNISTQTGVALSD
jgi:hypothetical protein